MDVKQAFAERKWRHYLAAPTIDQPHDPEITILSTAFLSQSIPYEYKVAIRQCETAHDIWRIFEQRYASKTREDEVRLEAQLLDFKKSAGDTLEQHITKFDNLIASIMDQQPSDRQYDDVKINQYFLRTLEMSNIPTENWRGFITFQGKNWLTNTKEQLYSEARTYYNTHIAPHLSTTSTDTNTSPTQTNESKAFIINSQAPDQNNQQRNDNNNNRGRGRGNYNNNYNNYNDNNNYNSNQYNGNQYNSNQQRPEYPRDRLEYPRDPNAWCNLHCKYGHSNEQCFAQQQIIAQLPPHLRPQPQTQAPTQTNNENQPQYQPYTPNSNVPPPFPKNAPPSNPTTLPPESTPRRIQLTSTIKSKNPFWKYDTTASDHVTWNPLHFHTFSKLENPIPIHVLDSVIYAYGHGTIVLQDPSGKTHALHNVLYIPDSRELVISQYLAKIHGLRLTIDQDDNFVLSSPNGFRIQSQSINRLTTFPDLKCIEYVPHRHNHSNHSINQSQRPARCFKTFTPPFGRNTFQSSFNASTPSPYPRSHPRILSPVQPHQFNTPKSTSVLTRILNSIDHILHSHPASPSTPSYPFRSSTPSPRPFVSQSSIQLLQSLILSALDANKTPTSQTTPTEITSSIESTPQSATTTTPSIIPAIIPVPVIHVPIEIESASTPVSSSSKKSKKKKRKAKKESQSIDNVSISSD